MYLTSPYAGFFPRAAAPDANLAETRITSPG
jgi:hypothetical protein